MYSALIVALTAINLQPYIKVHFIPFDKSEKQFYFHLIIL